MRRWRPLPAHVLVLALFASPRPRLALSPPSPVPPPSDAQATTNIKEMPLDRRETVISKRCRRDRAGPRITDDSNSQNVNVGYFQLKALVSQSVSQSQITMIIMLINSSTTKIYRFLGMLIYHEILSIDKCINFYNMYKLQVYNNRIE